MKNSNLHSIVQVIRLLDRKSKRRLAFSFVLMVVTGVLESLNVGMFLPLVYVGLTPGSGTSSVSAAINAATSWTGSSPLVVVSGAFFIVFFVKTAFLIWAIQEQSSFIAKLRARMTNLIVEAYAQKPYEKHLQVNSANAVFDISHLAPAVIVVGILQPALGMAMEAILALGAVITLFVFEPVAALGASFFVVVAMGLFYRQTRRKLYTLGHEGTQLHRTLARYAHFFLGSVKESTVLGRGRYFTQRIRAVTDDQARVESQAIAINQMPRIYGELIMFIAMIGLVAFIVAKIGSVVDALPILAVFGAAALRVFPSANRLVYYANVLRRSLPAFTSVYDELIAAREFEKQRELHKTTDKSAAPAPFQGEIQFDHVSYRYPGARDWTLCDIHFAIRPHEIVAFVGRTGAGKSTIVDILLGLLPPTEGRVMLDGVPIAANGGFWTNRVGYVPQNIYLLDDTLRRNVAFAIEDNEIDDERVRAVLKIARLDEMVGGLADGLDTLIGERGVRLSGGQRQRIGIARALYVDPEVLVLDEATSSLDSTTEREITDAIKTLAGHKSVILIAHRLSTVQGCDRLFFLDRGRIAAQGTFADVLAASGDFRTMVEQARLQPAQAIDAVA